MYCLKKDHQSLFYMEIPHWKKYYETVSTQTFYNNSNNYNEKAGNTMNSRLKEKDWNSLSCKTYSNNKYNVYIEQNFIPVWFYSGQGGKNKNHLSWCKGQAALMYVRAFIFCSSVSNSAVGTNPPRFSFCLERGELREISSTAEERSPVSNPVYVRKLWSEEQRETFSGRINISRVTSLCPDSLKPHRLRANAIKLGLLHWAPGRHKQTH